MRKAPGITPAGAGMDPDILELIRALARQAAKRDYLAAQARKPTGAPVLVHGDEN